MVLAQTLGEETRRVVAEKNLATALRRVTGLAVELGLGDWAGITEREGDARFATSGATADLVNVADHRQYELGEGPCVRASYEEGLLHSADVENDARWPKWGPMATEIGIASVLSVHLYSGSSGMGAMNVYSASSRDYTDQEKSTASIVGAHASIALSHFRREKHLWRAIDTRHVTGIAQGILCHQYHLDPEQAIGLLLRVSQQRNVSLEDLAAQVVAGRSGDILSDRP